MYKVIRKDIIDEELEGFVGDLKNLCAKYKIPDITLLPLSKRYIKAACRDLSRRRSMMLTIGLRKVPPLMAQTRIWNDYYEYPLMQARAITAMRTGNLIFKNWCPWKFTKKNMGDLRCLYPPCQEPDTLKHVLKCDFYRTKFIEGHESNTKDWAIYLVKLNEERIKEFK